MAVQVTFMNGFGALIDHWRDVLDLPIIEVWYEDLVRESETWMRRLLEFLDLPFDEACLSPHKAERVAYTASFEQVRRPISTSSIGRWRNYEHHLRPLVEALDPRLLEGPAAS